MHTTDRPRAEICSDFSSPEATALPWAEARAVLARAPLHRVTTVRPDGRPHMTPLLGIWRDGAGYFCTGEHERKALNLSENPHCLLSTGTDTLEGAPEVVVEGRGERVTDPAELSRVADAFELKYGVHLTSPEGTWYGLGETIRTAGVVVVRVTPVKAFAFGKAPVFGQTRYEFR